MNKYLISFHGAEPVSRIVEAPNASAALSLCISPIKSYEQIPDSLADKLVNGWGVKFVKWPY